MNEKFRGFGNRLNIRMGVREMLKMLQRFRNWLVQETQNIWSMPFTKKLTNSLYIYFVHSFWLRGDKFLDLYYTLNRS